jgi:pyruvate,water dikinase
VDRDSALVAHVFDERDPGVMALISRVIEGGRRNGVHSGICGQAPSDYPDFAAFLVREGIDSISLNPDSVLKITLRVLEMEREIGQSRRSAADGRVSAERAGVAPDPGSGR